MNWRETVRDEAELALETLEIDPEDGHGVSILVEDELFQELAIAHYSAELAHDVTMGIDASESEEAIAGDVEDAADELLELLERRAATVLLSYAFGGTEGSA